MAETYRPELALAKFLETMSIDTTGTGALVMVCTNCEEAVCDVEPNDTLRVLLNTALAHTDCGS
jgi:hypothetical protein